LADCRLPIDYWGAAQSSMLNHQFPNPQITNRQSVNRQSTNLQSAISNRQFIIRRC
jgi:hypothetical protein